MVTNRNITALLVRLCFITDSGRLLLLFWIVVFVVVALCACV